MRIRDLECFLQVCETGSINRAAVELNMAQPALGVLVRKLEHRFGATLIVRDNKGVRPTVEGEDVMAWAREVLDGRRKLVERVRRSSRDAAEFGMGLSPSAAALPPVRAMLSDGALSLGFHSRVVEESSHVLMGAVASRALDVALSFDTPRSAGVEPEPLLDQPLFLVGRAGEFEKTDKAAFEDVLRRDLIMGGAATSVRYVVDNAARALGREANVVQELMSLSLRKEFVRRGFGSTVLPHAVIADDIEAGRLSAARIVEPDVTRTLFLIRQAKRGRTNQETQIADIIGQHLRAAVAA